MNFTKIIDEVKKAILNHASPSRIWVYGSRITDEYYEGSDLDIAFDDAQSVDIMAIVDELNELDSLLKIDIKNINKADERFKNRVISTGRVVYSTNKKSKVKDALYNLKNALSKFKKVVERRNLSSHIYSEWQVREILPRLNPYLQAFEALLEKISGRFGNEEE